MSGVGFASAGGQHEALKSKGLRPASTRAARGVMRQHEALKSKGLRLHGLDDAADFVGSARSPEIKGIETSQMG